MKEILKYIIKVSAIALAYFIAGKLSLLLAIPPGFATPVWPAAGIALAAILLWGYRYFPGVFLGSFSTNLLIASQAGADIFSITPILVGLGIAFGASLQAGVGAFLVKKTVTFPTHLNNQNDVFAILLLGGVLGSLVNATIGPLVLLLTGLIASQTFFISLFTWWVGDTIGVILFTPILLILSAQLVSNFRKVIIIFPTLLFATLTTLTFFNAKEHQRSEVITELETTANNIAYEFKKSTDSYLDILVANESFFNASQFVDAEEFRTFTHRFFDLYPAIYALSWNPKISLSEKEAFEKNIRKQGFPDFAIKERLDISHIQPASERETYFPVAYIEPYNKNKDAHGYDVYSPDKVTNHQRQQILDQARDIGKTFATGQISIVQAENKGGLILYHPVYTTPSNTPENRRQNLKGYIAGVFIISEMLAPIKNLADKESLNIALYDLKAPVNQQLIYDSRTTENKASQPLPSNHNLLDTTVKLEVAGRQWELKFIQKDNIINTDNNWKLWYILIGGLLFSALFGAFIFILSSYADNYEEQSYSQENITVQTYLLPLLSSIIAISITLALWLQLEKHEYALVKEAMEKQPQSIKISINDNIINSIIALQRMAKRWEIAEGIAKKNWQADAQNYVQDHVALTTVEWVDDSYHVRWIEPLDGNKKALGLNIAFDKKRAELLQGASEKDTITITPPLDLVQGYKAFICYIPIYIRNKFDGFMVGIYDINIFLNKMITEDFKTLFNIQIMDGNTVVYRSIHDTEYQKEFSTHHDLKLFNRVWSISVWPKQKFIVDYKSPLTLMILVGGILVSILIGVAIYYALISRLHSKMLLDEKQRSELILNSAKEGIYGLDLEGTTIFANPAALKMCQYSAEEMLGASQHMLIHHSYPDKTPDPKEQCLIYESFTKGVEHTVDNEVFWRKDGSSFPVEYTANPIRNKSGEITGSMVVFRDITQRKLEEQELLAAKEKAEESNRLKSEFLANMSHEIRTPLNGIIGMNSLLLDTDLKPKQRSYTQTALNSANSLLELISDILDFSKIEAAKMELENIPFDLQALAEEICEIIKIKCYEKNIELLLHYKPDTPRHVIGDPGRVRQIMLNLLSNAVKFIESGHVLLEVQYNNNNNSNGKLSFDIKVEDTGIGIPKEKQDLIFEKFSQSDMATTRKYGGTGLGLAISRQLALMMGGDIKVKSKVNKGSTFFLTMELYPNTDEASSISYNPSIELKGVKALIIDESKVACDMLKEQLVYHGLNVDTSMDTGEALELAKKAAISKTPYDIIITNQSAPEMAGEELGKKIRNHSNLQHTILIIVTSSTQSQANKHFKEIGFDGHLSKPIYSSDLLKMLNILYDARKNNKKDITFATTHSLNEIIQTTSGHIKCLDASILLAEDNRTNVIVAQTMLEKMGCTVTVAKNGKEAVSFIQDQTFDLILMDCHMPEMDGFEATKQIIEYEKENNKEHTPIIAFTANALSGDKEQCLNVGMDDYMTKPIKSKRVEEIMIKWLPSTKIEQESTSKRPEKLKKK